MLKEYFLNVLKREAKDIKDFRIACDTAFMNLRQVCKIKTNKKQCKLTLNSGKELTIEKSEIPAFI